MTKTERKNLTKLVWVVVEDRRTEHKKKIKKNEREGYKPGNKRDRAGNSAEDTKMLKK